MQAAEIKYKLSENIRRVQFRMMGAALRSGRFHSTIKLVAVTKYVTVDVVRQLVRPMCNNLGESRPQELWSKAESLANFKAVHTSTTLGSIETPIHWHLIGHLQRNKVERTVPLVSLIHSGDSLQLMQAVNQAASKLNRPIPMLIEVNISGDTTKHGFKPDEIEPALTSIAALSSVQIQGLMCMASREGDLDQARREFAALRQLRERLHSVAPPNIVLQELSMGMSGDFEVAIEEGATMVRIGSAIFEGIA